MYYYIFDIRKCNKRSQVEDIKTYLGGLGISGEFTYPTAAQAPEELVDLALAKRYSTIVAIGGDDLATAIANRLLGRKEALGIIPLGASEYLSELIGTSNWREAAEALRFRKISEIRMGQTAAGNSFLTHIDLDIGYPIEVTLEFKDFLVQTKAENLIVANVYPGVKKRGIDYLDVLIKSAEPKDGPMLSRLASIFGAKKNNKDKLISLFRARSLRIFTKTPLALISNGKTIAKTPQLVESSDEPLRLITARKGAHPWE
ncbi:MAG: diacylglycerol kinase family protein [Patescibacteria group bacterium]